MAITINQAVDFCGIFRTQSLSEHGSFKKEHLKRLSQADRKVCMTALIKIEKAQLKDWESPEKAGSKKPIDPKRFSEITDKILDTPNKSQSKKTAWYKAPFVWVASSVNSIYLWFQNTFFGRISTKQLLNKVATYCQDANNAPHRIKTIEKDIIPQVDKFIKLKAQNKQKILQEKLANGLLEIYKILLALKSEAKRETIMSKAIAFSHVDGMEDLPSNPFYQIVRDCLEPYFKGDFIKSFNVGPYWELNQTAEELSGVKLTMQEPQGKLFDAKTELADAQKKLDELTSKYQHAQQEEDSGEVDPKLEEELSKAKERVKHWKETVAQKQGELDKDLEEFDEKSLELMKNFQKVAGTVRPLLIAKSSAMVRSILKDLYNSACQALKLEQQLNDAYQKAKHEDSSEAKESYNKLKLQLSQQTDKVNQQFDYSFNLIQANIELQGKALHELTYGKIKQSGKPGLKLKLSCLDQYGLHSLTKYHENRVNEAKLLKLKYKLGA